MRPLLFLTFLALPGLVAHGSAQVSTLRDASELEQAGHFTKAAALLQSAREGPRVNGSQRKTLAFELDRLERIKKDFPDSKESLFKELKEAVNDLTSEEFETWIAQGRFETRVIDGERCFMVSSVSNLFFRHPELNARRRKPKDMAAYHRALLENCRAIKQAALAGQKPYVLPYRFRVTMTVTAKAEVVPPGELIRAWLPVPRAYPFQKDFALLESSSPVIRLAPETSPIRSAYLEQPAQAGQPAAFKIVYEYTGNGIYFDLKPERVPSRFRVEAALRPFTREAPHVAFTDRIKTLSASIAGSEKNPALKAKKFY